jgi:hypothetical protein
MIREACFPAFGMLEARSGYQNITVTLLGFSDEELHGWVMENGDRENGRMNTYN